MLITKPEEEPNDTPAKAEKETPTKRAHSDITPSSNDQLTKLEKKIESLNKQIANEIKQNKLFYDVTSLGDNSMQVLETKFNTLYQKATNVCKLSKDNQRKVNLLLNSLIDLLNSA